MLDLVRGKLTKKREFSASTGIADAVSSSKGQCHLRALPGQPATGVPGLPLDLERAPPTPHGQGIRPLLQPCPPSSGHRAIYPLPSRIAAAQRQDRVPSHTGWPAPRLSQASSLTIPITQAYIGQNVHTSVWLASRCPTSTILPFSPRDHRPFHCRSVHSSAHW